jgi:ATP-dependent Clp endopeptidase proteolytic subunit ClpP
MEGHIFIYGEIIPWQDDDVAMYGCVNLKDVQRQIQDQPKADTLLVHINSIGGDVNEGFAIHDVLKASGKKIITQVEGLCASIATIVALAGEERRMTANSEFMIHCPVMWGGGTAEELQKQAEYLQEWEDKILDFYVQNTGSDRGKIKEMYKEETFLTSEEAKEYNFITDIITDLKAVARITQPNNNKMATQEEIKKQNNLLKSIKKMVKDLQGGARMVNVTTGDGSKLEFGDQIKEESEIAVGMTATIDGNPATGDQVLTDGRTLVFDSGKVSEIKDASTDDVKELQDQLAAKDKQIEKLMEAKKKTEKDMKAIRKGLKKMTVDFKDGKIISKETPRGNGDEVVRTPFKENND